MAAEPPLHRSRRNQIDGPGLLNQYLHAQPWKQHVARHRSPRLTKDGNGALRPVRAALADEKWGDTSLLILHTPPVLQNQITRSVADPLNTSPRPLPSALLPMTIKPN